MSLVIDKSDSSIELDMLLLNARVYTVNENFDINEAIGIKDGKIVFVGSNEEAEKLKVRAAEILDLDGQTLLPGFIESHAHLLNIGKAKMELDLTKASKWEDIVSQVKNAVQETSEGKWIVGRGWHHEKWDKVPDRSVDGFPTHHLLSLVSQKNPVYLTHANGHMAIVNDAALKLAGISSETKVSDDSEIILDDKKEPTGVLVEHAMNLIFEVMDHNFDSNKAFDLAVDECLSKGICSFYDMGSTDSMITVYRYKYGLAEVALRLSVTRIILSEDDIEPVISNDPELGLFDDHLDIRGIKILSDGALGSRGAWLLEEYTDRPGHFGNETFPVARIGEIASRCLKKGFQLIVHAIGDRANREILDQMSQAISENILDSLDHRFRIEHAQHLHPEDIPRFSQFNIIPSVQAIHLSSDRAWAIDRLGKKRIEDGAYMWKSLIESGATVLNGTDAPIEPVDPIPCFYAAVTRKNLKGQPSEGYEADQKMTREEAIRSYTIHGAYGMFAEESKGSIEIGKYADLVLLDTDIITCPEEEILDTQVLKTIINGKIVFDAQKRINEM